MCQGDNREKDKRRQEDKSQWQVCKSDKVRKRTRRQEWQMCQGDKIEIKKIKKKKTSDKRVKVTKNEGGKKRVKHKPEVSHFNRREE